MGSANEQGSVQILANFRDSLRDLKRLNNAIFQDVRPYNLVEIYQHSKGSLLPTQCLETSTTLLV